MSAGTITLTNGSAIVGGSGTSFATELAAGDFIVSTVGGVPYTLPVKTVDSNTQLTLVSNYTGPTQSGAAWSAVPRVALNMVTAALVAQSAEALRGLNYDKQNWQQVYSAAGNITVKLPDGTTFTGPSWKYLSDNMATKSGGAVPINQGGTGSTTASGARANLGLGNSAIRDVGAAAGTVAAGDDSRLNTVDQKSGGSISSSVDVGAGNSVGVKSAGTAALNSIMFLNKNFVPDPATYAAWLRANSGTGFLEFGPTRSGAGDLFSVVMTVKGSANSGAAAFTFWPDGNADATNWRNSSDPRLKNDITRIVDPLEKMKLIRGYTWRFKKHGTFGIGFLSTDVKKVFPDAVSSNEEITETLPDGTVVKAPDSVDLIGVAAGLHHEAILALMEQVEDLKKKIDALQPES
ncbi:tail fiber domain-containing protein [Enterobacter roggenkampii]|uniref:tail fiber domain-containing protein n=1 Tax=Enterobacter roggenkampii TaxID=1812935 RepID=UPI003B83B0AF